MLGMDSNLGLRIGPTEDELIPKAPLRGRGVNLYQLPSPRFLYSVYVLITLPLGEDWAIDRTPDSEGKLQPTVNQRGS